MSHAAAHLPIAFVLFAVVLTACGGDAPDDCTGSVALTVSNQSQFELLELRVHRGADYRTAEDILRDPLPVDAQIHLPTFRNDSSLTVVRRRVDVGDTMALTTAEALCLPTSGYLLEVFDESFRLVEPRHAR